LRYESGESIYHARPNRNISRNIKGGLARAAYLETQILQNPVTPKKALYCFYGLGEQETEDWVDPLMTQGASLSLYDHTYVGDLREA
jgi:hypothetical protein